MIIFVLEGLNTKICPNPFNLIREEGVKSQIRHQFLHQKREKVKWDCDPKCILIDALLFNTRSVSMLVLGEHKCSHERNKSLVMNEPRAVEAVQAVSSATVKGSAQRTQSKANNCWHAKERMTHNIKTLYCKIHVQFSVANTLIHQPHRACYCP